MSTISARAFILGSRPVSGVSAAVHAADIAALNGDLTAEVERAQAAEAAAADAVAAEAARATAAETALQNDLYAIRAGSRLPKNRHGLRYALTMGSQVASGLRDDGSWVEQDPLWRMLELMLPAAIIAAIRAGGQTMVLPKNRHGLVSVTTFGREVAAYTLDNGESYNAFGPTESMVTSVKPMVMEVWVGLGQSGRLGSRGFATYTEDGSGGFSAATVLSDQPSEYGDLCLMLSGGAGDFIRAWGVPPHTYTGLEPIREKWDGGVCGETGMAEFTRMYMQQMQEGGDPDLRLGAFIAAKGDSDWADLGPGTNIEQYILSALRAFKEQAGRLGMTVRLGGFLHVHGENPAGSGNGAGAGYYWPQYLAELDEWRTWALGLVAQVFGEEPYSAPFMMVQLSRVSGTLPASSNEGVSQAMLIKHLTDPYFVLTGPRYTDQYYDGVHSLGLGYTRHHGVAAAYAYANKNGTKRDPLMMVSAIWDGAKIVIGYNNVLAGAEAGHHGPVGALVLDAVLGNSPGDGNKGFALRGAGVTITGVSLGAGGTTVEITLSGTPAPGSEVLYAIGPVYGGQLRDSDDRLVNPHSSIPNYNWAVGQVMEINTFGATELARFDPSHPETIWQDASGYVSAAADGAPVARIFDLSGRGSHLGLTTPPADQTQRPIHTVDGAWRHWLNFDGVNDKLDAAIAEVPASHIAVLAADVTGWTAHHAALISLAGVAGWMLTAGHDTELRLSLYGDGVTTATGPSPITPGPHVFAVVADATGDTLTLRVDGEVYFTTPWTGTVTPAATLRLMGSRYNSAWVSGRLAHFALGNDISTPAISALETLAALRAGITL